MYERFDGDFGGRRGFLLELQVQIVPAAEAFCFSFAGCGSAYLSALSVVSDGDGGAPVSAFCFVYRAELEVFYRSHNGVLCSWGCSWGGLCSCIGS